VLAWSKGALRGIATLDVDATEDEMDALGRAGVIGQRFDLAALDIDRLKSPAGTQFLAKLRHRGWLAELQMNARSPLALLGELLIVLKAAGLPLVFGHYSQPSPLLPDDQPIFAQMMGCANDGSTVIKLSSFFRHSQTGLPYADLDPFIERVLDAFGPSRCVWGSDWPFTRFPGHVTYEEELACIERWLPSPEDREQVRWKTAARVFGFDASTTLQSIA
jgi:predicted TIM-barrel fold metal-dependent hydrolase